MNYTATRVVFTRVRERIDRETDRETGGQTDGIHKHSSVMI